MNKPKKVPIRTCVSCRESSEKRQLTRIVRTPEDGVRIDITGKMSGRGAYLCGKKECLSRAIKQNRLSRALRCEVPQEIIEELSSIVVDDDDQK